MNKILIINAGSSSIKWTLFSNNLEQEAKGIAQRIKMKQGSLLLNFNGQKFEENLPLPSFLETVKQLVKQWEENKVIEKLKLLVKDVLQTNADKVEELIDLLAGVPNILYQEAA